MEDDRISILFSESAIDTEPASVLPSIGCGGECIFIGRTRPETNQQHGDLLALRYECYIEMAEQELRTLASEAINRFSVEYVQVTHAIGTVEVGEASVVIAVSSKHRSDAFTACRFLIDLLKLRIPIWKQELWADGTTWNDGKPLHHTKK